MTIHALFTQGQPAVEWEIQLPDGAERGRPLAAYDVSGDSMHIDHWRLEDDTLYVSFGIDAMAGVLDYAYHESGEISSNHRYQTVQVTNETSIEIPVLTPIPLVIRVIDTSGEEITPNVTMRHLFSPRRIVIEAGIPISGVIEIF